MVLSINIQGGPKKQEEQGFLGFLDPYNFFST